MSAQILTGIFVRQSATFTTTSATITAALNGSALIMIIASQRSPSARTVSSLSCTNVIWTGKIGGTTNGVIDGEIWLGTVSGGSSGTTVTITMSGAGATICGEFIEFAAVTGTADTATAVTATGSSTTPAIGSYSPNQDSLVLILAVWANGTAASATPGGRYVNLQDNANSTVCSAKAAYILDWSTPAVAALPSASWTITSAAWVTVAVAVQLTTYPVRLENFKTITAGSGISVGEKIR